jgi:UDP-N-acetyl-D-galactosamine dehydrogenase
MKIAVIGLGYVGLPLALELGKIFETIGFDISNDKVNFYNKKIDPSGELTIEDFTSSKLLRFTTQASLIASADFIIVAVPTPVNKANQPDFSPLVLSSETVGRYIKPGAIVVYESTVYPGATEEICVPIIEKFSKLKWKKDFFIGYSPERINPGDKDRTIVDITKIVSGDSKESLEVISFVYGSIIKAGIYKAASIKVAEAAKVIENTQRDLNIALMNELAIIFNKIGIDTSEVLEAAGTKWNFMPFRPGLVGGHCIGVDPYYLTYKAELEGYHPQVILSGRFINDSMADFIALEVIKRLIHKGCNIKESKIVILGLTFKENCADIRNSKVAKLFNSLNEFGCEIFVHDPLASTQDSFSEYGINLLTWDDLPENSDALIVAVPHKEYLNKSIDDITCHLGIDGLFVDIKSAFNKEIIKNKGFQIWRL